MAAVLERIAAFFDILSTHNMLIEIGAVALCLAVGWFVGTALRDRYERRRFKTPTGLTWDYFKSQGTVVATPAIVALVLVILARGALQAAHFDVTMLDAASRLIGAYVVVRVAVLLFAASLGNNSWMQHWDNRVTLFIWLAIAAEYLGWLDPIISTMDSIGVAAGKSRITLWSILKVLLTLN